MGQQGARWLRGYLAVVISVGAVLVMAGTGIDGRRFLTSPLFWVLLAIIVVLESYSIRLPASQDDSEITTSTTFAYALLLLEGPAAAAVAFAAGALANGLTHHKQWYKAAFNAGQFVLAAAVCGLVLVLTAPGYTLAGQPPAFGPQHLPGALLGGAVFIMVNFALVESVVARAAGVPVLSHARRNLTAAVGPMVVMVALAPMVAVVAQASLWFMPVFTVPIIALFKMAEISVAKEHLALHDALTNLPNRRLFSDRLEQALLGHKRHGTGMAVLSLDLDRFKEVNETLGHTAGDELLRAVATRLSGAIPVTDTVARLGGDEFGVVLREVDANEADGIARDLRAALLDPVVVAGVRLEVPATVGIACALPDDDPSELLRRATTAMARAKDLRLDVAAYDPQVDPDASADTRARLALGNQLRGAMVNGEIAVVYQPQINLADGRVVAVEALARWQHPERGLLGAGILIPVAEATGLIRALSLHVMRHAVAEVARWRAQHGIALRVSVNVVAHNLLDPDLPAIIEEATAAAGLAPHDLCLEITEGDILLNPADSLAVLTAVQALGVTVAIDDFGTGMSSLARLRDLPVDELKVDRSFVANLRDKRSLAFVRAIVALGHELGLRVVGEGVENALMLETLTSLDVELAQGFLFSVPLAGVEYLDWHQRWTRQAAVESPSA